MRLWDKNKQHETSLSDSEDEGTGGRRHRQSHRDAASNGTRQKRRSRSPRSNGASSTPGPAPGPALPAGTAPASGVATGLEAKAPETSAAVAAPTPNGTTIDSGLLENPPTADALRTTKASGDEDVEMGSGETDAKPDAPVTAPESGGGGGVADGAASGAGVGDMVAGGA